MTDGGQDGVDRIAFGSAEVVSFQMAVILHMADHRLDRVSSAHFAPDGGSGDAAGVGDGDIEAIALDLVATVSTIGVSAFDGVSGQSGDLVDLPGKAVSVIGVARQRHGPEDELAALGALVGGGN